MREGAESPETGSQESEDAENLDETAKTDLMVYVVVADGLVVYRREARQLLLGLGSPVGVPALNVAGSHRPSRVSPVDVGETRRVMTTVVLPFLLLVRLELGLLVISRFYRA
jgi:hypothetical protein